MRWQPRSIRGCRGFDPMAVAINDNANNSNAQNGGTAVNTYNLAVITAASNLAIVALVCWDNSLGGGGVTVSSVVWDPPGANQALTAIPNTTVSNGVTSAQLWGRVGTITAGTKNLVMTLSAISNSYLSFITYSGVDQTGGATSFPHGTSATGSTNAPSISIMSATGNFVVAAECDGDGSNTSRTDTSVFANNSGSSNNAFGNTKAGAGLSVTLSGVNATAANWSYAGCDVLAAGAAVAARGGTLPLMGVGRRRTYSFPRDRVRIPPRRLIVQERGLIIPARAA
jgi:hypothetical protein